MVRTQLYLTAEERDALSKLAQRTGRKQSELVREAVDAYLDREAGGERRQMLRELAGIWNDREDVPDFTDIRREWDRDNVDRG